VRNTSYSRRVQALDGPPSISPSDPDPPVPPLRRFQGPLSAFTPLRSTDRGHLRGWADGGRDSARREGGRLGRLEAWLSDRRQPRVTP